MAILYTHDFDEKKSKMLDNCTFDFTHGQQFEQSRVYVCTLKECGRVLTVGQGSSEQEAKDHAIEKFSEPIIVERQGNESEFDLCLQEIYSKNNNAERFLELKRMFEQGKVEFKPNDNTPSYALVCGLSQVFQFFIEHGAMIHRENNTNIRACISYNNLPMLKYLIEKGANIFYEELQCLTRACRVDLEMLKYLLSLGLDFKDCEFSCFLHALKTHKFQVATFMYVHYNSYFDKLESAVSALYHDDNKEACKYLVTLLDVTFYVLDDVPIEFMQQLIAHCNKHKGKCHYVYSSGCIAGGYCRNNTKNIYCKKHKKYL